MRSPEFYDLQAKAKAGGCFIVAKNGEYLLYRQMPEGATQIVWRARSSWRRSGKKINLRKPGVRS